MGLRLKAEFGAFIPLDMLTPAEHRKILGSEICRPPTKGNAVHRVGGKLTTGVARQFHRDGGK